ncbi:serglycin [Betta splendens]|uniref:Serglycin n=1 Tax=Betta splendens TaxID=158456 RepID=A0A8M1HBY7_BETSP|nr:serglycin [Betta splendens]
MKLILLLVLSCLALHNAKGAPTTGRYMLVKCSPKDTNANCVTYRSSEIALTPDLPTQLPASSAKHLEVVPVQDEHPDMEEGELEAREVSDEGESPYPLYEYGSGLEGSTDEGGYYADQAFVNTGSDTGSGESNMDLFKGEEKSSWPVADEPKAAEEDLMEDHLLQM